jgi:lysozyme
MVMCSVSASSRASDNFIPLVDDLSRSFLGRLGAQIEEPGTKGVGPKFKLPDKADPSYTYGIDISHHNFSNGKTIDWYNLPSKRVSFVYMKATQGARFVDPTLASNWVKAQSVADRGRVLRKGAYHFFSAEVDPESQAAAFLKALKELTSYDPKRDLPPTLDLEWDLRTQNGKILKDESGNVIDRWKTLKPQQIVERVNLWIRIIKKELGVTPVVYTNAQWWKSVGLDGLKFDYNPKLWVADYSVRANGNFKPAAPVGHRWTIWQFTDSALIDGREIDGNVFIQDEKSFIEALQAAPNAGGADDIN